MQKQTSILLGILFSSFALHSQINLDNSETRIAITPTSHLMHKQILESDIRRGHTINNPGLYSLNSSHTNIESGDSPTNSHNVGGSAETRPVIAITSSNVVLDLGGGVISTDKSSQVAITIEDGLHDVIIRNGVISSGSANFDCGILVGQSCTNIMINDIVVQGTSHADGAIHFKGTSENTTNNVTLKDVIVSGNSTIGLKCSYCNNLHMKDVYANSNTHTGALSSINFNNCNNITGLNINANNNNGASSTIALEIDTCKDVDLEGVSVTSNTHSDAGNSTEGIKINASNNVYLSQVKANNLAKTKSGITCLASKNVSIEDLEISNCTVSSAALLKSISITNSQSLEIKHAVIANNVVVNQSFTGIALATATNKYITLHDIHIINNSSTGATRAFTGIELLNTEMAVISNCSVSRNMSAGDTYGIKVLSSSSDIHLKNSHVIHNTSSATTTGKIVAGIHCAAVEGLKIHNCESVRNTGTGQAYGTYLDTVNHAIIDGCMMNGNAAATGIAEHKPSAGLYMKRCSYCLVKNSSFINNKAGSNTTASTTDAVAAGVDFSTGTTIGAGIINIGATPSLLSIGNHFSNCICNSNRTQLGVVDPGVGYVVYDGATARRYSTRYALSAGAANQWAKNSEYRDCTFNDNGFSDFVIGSGLLNVNDAQKTHCISCTASNNNYFGFCDDGSLETTQLNAEIFFIGCLAITNGAASSVATTEETNDHIRNCRIYYSTGAGTEVPAFVQMNFDTYTQLTTENSPFINVSVKHTS